MFISKSSKIKLLPHHPNDQKSSQIIPSPKLIQNQTVQHRKVNSTEFYLMSQLWLPRPLQIQNLQRSKGDLGASGFSWDFTAWPQGTKSGGFLIWEWPKFSKFTNVGSNMIKLLLGSGWFTLEGEAMMCPLRVEPRFAWPCSDNSKVKLNMYRITLLRSCVMSLSLQL